jgi:hypothetical protein
VVIEAAGTRIAGYGVAGGIAAGGIAVGGIDGAEAVGLDEPLPVALEAFLRQAEVDPDLQEALSTAADAAAVAEIACGAGFDVGEADLWSASDETPEALQEPQLNPPAATELADPWGVEESPTEKA